MGRPSLVRDEGDEGEHARPLDGAHQLALVTGAGSRDPPGQDLGALGDVVLQGLEVLVVDPLGLLLADLAVLAPPEEEAPPTGSPSPAAAPWTSGSHAGAAGRTTRTHPPSIHVPLAHHPRSSRSTSSPSPSPSPSRSASRSRSRSRPSIIRSSPSGRRPSA